MYFQTFGKYLHLTKCYKIRVAEPLMNSVRNCQISPENVFKQSSCCSSNLNNNKSHLPTLRSPHQSKFVQSSHLRIARKFRNSLLTILRLHRRFSLSSEFYSKLYTLLKTTCLFAENREFFVTFVTMSLADQ